MLILFRPLGFVRQIKPTTNQTDRAEACQLIAAKKVRLGEWARLAYTMVAALPFFCPSASHAENETAQPGAKANVTLALVINSSAGIYRVQDSALFAESQKGLEYPGDEIVNPFGFNPVEARANYYSVREFHRSLEIVPGTFLPSQISVASGTRVVSRRFGNREFLDALSEQGVIPETSGYRIVSVFLPSWESRYLFAEKTGALPVFLGAAGNGTESRSYLGYNIPHAAGSRTSLLRTTYKYKTVSEIDPETEMPRLAVDEAQTTLQTTYESNNKGEGLATLEVLPGFQDDRNLVGTGLATYSYVFQKSAQLSLAGPITISGIVGKLRISDAYYTLVKGSLSVSAERYCADVQPYMDALENR